jgi:hypothetical protein
MTPPSSKATPRSRISTPHNNAAQPHTSTSFSHTAPRKPQPHSVSNNLQPWQLRF